MLTVKFSGTLPEIRVQMDEFLIGTRQVDVAELNRTSDNVKSAVAAVAASAAAPASDSPRRRGRPRAEPAPDAGHSSAAPAAPAAPVPAPVEPAGRQFPADVSAPDPLTGARSVRLPAGGVQGLPVTAPSTVAPQPKNEDDDDFPVDVAPPKAAAPAPAPAAVAPAPAAGGVTKGEMQQTLMAMSQRPGGGGAIEVQSFVKEGWGHDRLKQIPEEQVATIASAAKAVLDGTMTKEQALDTFGVL